MAGHDIFTYECSRKLQADNMTTKMIQKQAWAMNKEKSMKYNPELLFQQFLFVAPSNLIDMDEFISFELAVNEQILTEKITKKADGNCIKLFLLAVVVVSVMNDLKLWNLINFLRYCCSISCFTQETSSFPEGQNIFRINLES